MRRIAWVTGALKDFQTFPEPVRDRIMFALRIAAQGEKADTAKPMKGFGAGVFEIAVRPPGCRFQDSVYRTAR
jgi:phage-related protein